MLWPLSVTLAWRGSGLEIKAAFALEVRDSGMFQILMVQSWLLVTTKLSFSLKGMEASSAGKQFCGFSSLTGISTLSHCWGVEKRFHGFPSSFTSEPSHPCEHPRPGWTVGAVGWHWLRFETPSNPNHSMIPSHWGTTTSWSRDEKQHGWEGDSSQQDTPLPPSLPQWVLPGAADSTHAVGMAQAQPHTAHPASPAHAPHPDAPVLGGQNTNA